MPTMTTKWVAIRPIDDLYSASIGHITTKPPDKDARLIGRFLGAMPERYPGSSSENVRQRWLYAGQICAPYTDPYIKD